MLTLVEYVSALALRQNLTLTEIADIMAILNKDHQGIPLSGDEEAILIDIVMKANNGK